MIEYALFQVMTNGAIRTKRSKSIMQKYRSNHVLIKHLFKRKLDKHTRLMANPQERSVMNLLASQFSIYGNQYSLVTVTDGIKYTLYKSKYYTVLAYCSQFQVHCTSWLLLFCKTLVVFIVSTSSSWLRTSGRPHKNSLQIVQKSSVHHNTHQKVRVGNMH